MQKDLNLILKYTEPVGECLEWQRCLNSEGYARANFSGNVNGKVHRVVYELTHPDEDIASLVIRHTCDNRKCINPRHLISGNPVENVADRTSRGRTASKLNRSQVRAIRNLWRSGCWTQQQLADAFEVSKSNIQAITSNSTWKTVV